MSDKMKIVDKMGCSIDRSREFVSALKSSGMFKYEFIRDGKVFHEETMHNGITTEGKNFLLDVMFHGTTAAPTWWIGLIDNALFGALAATDTYDNINQAGNDWDEFSLYGAGDRIEWV